LSALQGSSSTVFNEGGRRYYWLSILYLRFTDNYPRPVFGLED
jgi:hypothetical protein